MGNISSAPAYVLLKGENHLKEALRIQAVHWD